MGFRQIIEEGYYALHNRRQISYCYISDRFYSEILHTLRDRIKPGYNKLTLQTAFNPITIIPSDRVNDYEMIFLETDNLDRFLDIKEYKDKFNNMLEEE